MTFSDITKNIKSFFVSLYEKITAYIQENKKLSIMIGSLLGVIIVTLIILIIALNKPKAENKLKPQLILTEDLILPEGPELKNEYNISRQAKDSWSEKEADEWFTIPGTRDIESLGKANDGIISEILGAAP